MMQMRSSIGNTCDFVILSLHTPAIQYRNLLLNTFQYCVVNFEGIVEDALEFICESFLAQTKLDDASSKQIVLILNNLLENYPKLHQIIVQYCISRFNEIQNTQILKIILWSFGEYIETPQQINECLNLIKLAIGTVPFEIERKREENINGKPEEQKKKAQARIRTVILPDGTYGTEVVEDGIHPDI